MSTEEKPITKTKEGKSKRKVKYEVELPPDVLGSLQYQAKQEGINVSKIVEDMLDDGFYTAFFDVSEAVVKLKYIAPWEKSINQLSEVGEGGEETESNLKEYRRLREEFAPVGSGIDYYKAFTSGSGFDVKVDNPKDQHQIEAREEINHLNRTIFMDDITVGLDAIQDIMIDDTFTEGLSAAEIVYEGWQHDEFKFEDWVTVTELQGPNDVSPRYIPKDLTDEDWKQLKGIVQLKILPNAYTRLTPYRDSKTWKILYYTIDEKSTTDKDNVIKLLPWQVLWLSWNRRGNSLKGTSMIKLVAKTSILLERILQNLGISIDRWADKKYFFILGDAKTGRSWSPQNIRNFLNDVKEMTTQHKTGVPVPAGFDVKQIGGEVYDGGQIVDNLISMICGGLKYPRTFLEQGKTQEGDKAWLAWLVSYGRHQTQLKRCIEHQLWARHLYCKFGTKRTISKQGVPKADQLITDIYIPRMEWSSEGRWHQETKLKMLKDWLNVANPVTPVFKIGIEEDAAVTLGYSEMAFEEVRNQMEVQTQTEGVQKQIDLVKKKMELEALEKAFEDKAHLEQPAVLSFIQAPKPEPIPSPDKGQPKELTQEERLQKRLEGGVSVRRDGEKPSRKGISKPMGSTRSS